jgi:hypothetical protein
MTIYNALARHPETGEVVEAVWFDGPMAGVLFPGDSRLWRADKVDDMTPRISGPIAESWVIERGRTPRTEWLTPDREWQGSIFEAARFELNEREKVEWWLKRELGQLPPEQEQSDV